MIIRKSIEIYKLIEISCTVRLRHLRKKAKILNVSILTVLT